MLPLAIGNIHGIELSKIDGRIVVDVLVWDEQRASSLEVLFAFARQTAVKRSAISTGLPSSASRLSCDSRRLR